MILFDEHGGCYDHVPPPSASECEVAIAPDRIIPAGQPGGIGFKFDRLGPRVPAIIVSAYTPPQTRLHHIFEHTSILSTVVNCFGLPQGKLAARQAKARDLRDALTLPSPRQDLPPIAKPHFSFVKDVGEVALHRSFEAPQRQTETDLELAKDRAPWRGTLRTSGRPPQPHRED